MTLPTTHRTISVTEDPKGLAVKEKSLPVINDEEILVKVVAVALNPTDFKHVYNYAQLKGDSSLGCDFAGDIVEMGKNAENMGFKVGDPVAGFIRGGIPDSANGTFQQYVKTLPELTWKIPKEHLSYEEAAPMGGIALSTAAHSMYNMLKLPPPWAPAKEPFPFLVWSGATSVGMCAIRLAKLSGLTVATTASPKNHAYLKELGADVVFDYRDPDSPAKIKEWSSGKIEYGYDTISEHGTTQMAMAAFSDKGGKMVTVLPPKKGEDDKVELERVYIYTVLERGTAAFAAISEWYRQLPQFVEKLKVIPLKRWPGGLDAIPEALEFLRAGKTSAEKIVVTL